MLSLSVWSGCFPHPGEEKRASWHSRKTDAQDLKCRVQSMSAALGGGVTTSENVLSWQVLKPRVARDPSLASLA